LNLVAVDQQFSGNGAADFASPGNSNTHQLTSGP